MTPEITDATRIEELSLPVRAYNVLRRAGLDTVGEVRNTPESQIAAQWACGVTTLAAIREAVGGFAAEPDAPIPQPAVKPPRSLDSRRERWLAQFHEGATYQEIADPWGLSRERVRQVLMPTAEDRALNTAARERAKRELAEQYTDEIRRLLLEGMTQMQVAKLLGVRRVDVQVVYDTLDERAMRRRLTAYLHPDRKFTDEDLVGYVRDAARILGRDGLGAVAYERLRKSDPEHVRAWPSVMRIQQRLGWSEACRRAGLEVSERPKGMGLAKFSDEQMYAALRRITRLMGHAPSMGEYEKHYVRGEEPGMLTVRNRFGAWMPARAWAQDDLESSS